VCAPVWLTKAEAGFAPPSRKRQRVVMSSFFSPGLEWLDAGVGEARDGAPGLAPPSDCYATHSSVRNCKNTAEILPVALNAATCAAIESVMLSASVDQRVVHDPFAWARSRPKPAPRCCPGERADAPAPGDAGGQDLSDLVEALGGGHQFGVERPAHAGDEMLALEAIARGKTGPRSSIPTRAASSRVRPSAAGCRLPESASR
jgi:hypothetical protein